MVARLHNSIYHSIYQACHLECRIAGGLAWFAFLAVGSLGEQVKTRLEVSKEAAGAQDVDADPVTLPSGVSYQDVRIGGGSVPKKGDLVVLQYRYGCHTHIRSSMNPMQRTFVNLKRLLHLAACK